MQKPLRFLTDEHWSELLQRAQRRTFAAGDVILEEGSPNRALYILRRGCLRVEHEYLNGRVEISRLGPGEIFGEMSFVEEALASASVVADEAAEVDCLDEGEFASLLAADLDLAARFYRSLACTLAERLRRRQASLPLSVSLPLSLSASY